MNGQIGLAAVTLGVVSGCNLSSFEAFDLQEFRADQARGETIVLHFYDDF